jgi:hypothetical protein
MSNFSTKIFRARHRWLTPINLRRQRSGGSWLKTSQANSLKPYLKKKKKITEKGWWSGSRYMP